MGKVIIGIAVVVGFFIFFSLFLNIKGFSDSRYSIDTPDSVYYTDTYREENGCITFRDKVYDNQNKVCGIYSIRDKGVN